MASRITAPVATLRHTATGETFGARRAALQSRAALQRAGKGCKECMAGAADAGSPFSVDMMDPSSPRPVRVEQFLEAAAAIGPLQGLARRSHTVERLVAH
eukprot:gene31847-5199_t